MFLDVVFYPLGYGYAVVGGLVGEDGVDDADELGLAVGWELAPRAPAERPIPAHLNVLVALVQGLR
ncbi:hypothetical protein [Corynebacterium sp. 5QC2CO]|uniref:hypothetical protein n=1 Tax=Corynebacterium sp. 5QC2CO TaxID=2968468 RepID=UPI00211C0723|nr:hypothetical protein [Corynebacterium sp. 5QC2CO]MCQ9349374.1 hypothetical protein [Corynebacterium sp. 5QC2CO]